MKTYNYKSIPNFEACQVPEQRVDEAAKDVEERYRMLCAWLDEKGMIDIDFIPRLYVEFKSIDGFYHLAPSGTYILINEDRRVEVIDQAVFVKLFQEV